MANGVRAPVMQAWKELFLEYCVTQEIRELIPHSRYSYISRVYPRSRPREWVGNFPRPYGRSYSHRNIHRCSRRRKSAGKFLRPQLPWRDSYILPMVNWIAPVWSCLRWIDRPRLRASIVALWTA